MFQGCISTAVAHVADWSQVFRQTGAGDTLRDVYQSLTADPHSLANLDQVPTLLDPFLKFHVAPGPKGK